MNCIHNLVNCLIIFYKHAVLDMLTETYGAVEDLTCLLNSTIVMLANFKRQSKACRSV